jgi:hypothetical protein
MIQSSTHLRSFKIVHLSCAWEDLLNKTSEPAAFMLKLARQS